MVRKIKKFICIFISIISVIIFFMIITPYVVPIQYSTSYVNYTYTPSRYNNISMKNSKTVSKPVTGETANFIGYVKYTLLLQNNTLMNGNYNTTTGEQPGSIVYDPSNKFLYTANDYMNAATIINGTNNSVITNVTVGNTPDAISYDPVQKYIYVSNFNSSDVSALNTSTNSVTSIGVDQYPADSVYVGSAKSVYVDISAFNEVEIINPVTGTTTATKIPVGTSPVGIAYDPAENYLFVANAQSHNVTVINVATHSL